MIYTIKDSSNNEAKRSLNLRVPFMFCQNRKNLEEIIKKSDLKNRFLDSAQTIDFSKFSTLLVSYSAESYVTNSVEIINKDKNHLYLELRSRISPATTNTYNTYWTTQVYKIEKQMFDSLTIYFKNDDLQNDLLRYSLK